MVPCSAILVTVLAKYCSGAAKFSFNSPYSLGTGTLDHYLLMDADSFGVSGVRVPVRLAGFVEKTVGSEWIKFLAFVCQFQFQPNLGRISAKMCGKYRYHDHCT